MTPPAARGSLRPPGWHPDETDAARLRYWDGSGWTPHTAARSDGPAAAHEQTLRWAAAPDHTTVPTPRATDAGGPARRAGEALVAIASAASLVVAGAALAVALLR